MGAQQVQVTLHLPAEQYRRVAAVATAKGVNAHSLIEHLVQAALTPKPPTPRPSTIHQQSDRVVVTEAMLDRIRELNAACCSDATMARVLGISKATVAVHRRRLGLPPRGKAGRPPAAGR
ncbi:hypothetical protein [Plantibacter sp. YIM 135249]|uniref:hypothetical protein n=1 Tax=Plantibacter sp. YIM 135249 TaxID=3423918 RepID=UPI003D324A41